MGSELREQLLPESAITYLRSELVKGHSYSASLLSLPFGRGRALTWLPEGFSPKGIDDLTSAPPANLGMDFTGHAAQVAGFIHAYLSKELKRIALFEALESPHGNSPLLRRFQHLAHEDELYLMLTSATATLDEVHEAMARSRDYPFIAGLVALISDLGALDAGGRTSGQFLNDLAQQTEHIVVGAFDARGFIVWSRRP
jgi:hypothetical protein